MNATTGTQIETSNSFYEAYKQLDRVLQRRVALCLEKLRIKPRPPGLHVEKVKGARPKVRSCRVGRRARIIFEITELATTRLLYVNSDHNAAYRWAVNYWLTFNNRDEAGETSAEDIGDFTMFQSDEMNKSLQEDLRSVLQGAQLPDNLAGRIAELISQTLIDGTDSRALPLSKQSYENQGSVNVIPSGSDGRCGSVLVAFCFDADSFSDRLREVAYQAGIHCPNTKLVILITSRWNPKEWKKNHERAFADLKAMRLIYLAGFGRLTRIA